MEMKILQKEVNKIEMSKDMEDEIIQNCHRKMEDKKMSKNTSKKFYMKPMVAVAALALCLCLTGMTAMAAQGKMQGFFKDIKNWNGAVTGTTYEQATDEVEMTTYVEENKVVVTLSMVQPDMAPYSFFELFGIQNYQIVDAKGNVLFEGSTAQSEITGGEVIVDISIADIAKGDYKLLVTQLIGSSKVDQPLVISGRWESEFTKK